MSSDPRIRALLSLGRGRLSSVSSPGWPALLESMSPVGQRAFAADTRQGPIALAGRGGGKSFAALAKYHRPSAAHPNCSSVFVAISSERARDIMLPAVWALNDKYGLGITERRGDKSVVWPNGYRLLFRGCGDKSECDKRRGTPWVAAGWDECASINSDLLAYDIHECVEPRLADFRGQWFAGGTPGPVQHGYWYALSSGAAGFPVHRWDARTNPYIEMLSFMLGALQRMQGVPARELWPAGCTSLLDIINEPKYWHLLPATFVREYLGQWVLDLQAIIYRITARNSYTELPIDPDRWTIGCDLGGNSPDKPDLDHAAITVAASHTTLPIIWLPESRKLVDITVDSLCEELRALYREYKSAPVIHLDNSSAGEIILKTFRRMGLPIQPALRGPKLRRIQLVQGIIENGNLQLHRDQCMDLRREAVTLTWDDSRTLHHERCADDCWDSALYAILPHLSDKSVAPPINPPTHDEWVRRQELDDYEAALQAAIDENRM